MTSILTNISAMSALQTLRAVASSLGETQERVSSGLRVGNASDNAAYWSISTTMRSDNGALSAVSDALGLGAAKVDTAYAGLESVIDVLAEFQAKLVAASEAGVDKTKIQEELDQLKQQVENIAQSASFSGQNWLNTNIENIYDIEMSTTSVTSGFVRNAGGHVAVKQLDVHLSNVALFNSTGGGLLQADARYSETVGGIRYFDDYNWETYSSDRTVYSDRNESGWMYPEWDAGSHATMGWNLFPAGSPLDFNIPGAEISFDLLLDKEASHPQGDSEDNAILHDLPGPYFAGEPFRVTLTKDDIDTFYPSLNGIVTTNTEFASVLNRKLQSLGAGASFGTSDMRDPITGNTVHNPRSLNITTHGRHSPGSYVEISNLSSVGVSTGGLAEGEAFGRRGSGMVLTFEDFIVHKDGDNPDGIEISFAFSLNGRPATTHSFDRTYVNDLLGTEGGKIGTPEEMAMLLHSLLDADWPGLIIEATPEGNVLIKSDPAIDREWGGGTSITFDNIRVSNEPLPILNFLEIDIVENPDMIADYIQYMETATARVISGAATLGALQARIEMQSEFTSKLMDSIDRGVGRLVDADMNEESSRLKALQTQQQLAIQSLSIANTSADTIMQLFR